MKKQQKQPVIFLRVDPKLKKAVERDAKRLKCSTNEWVVNLIQNHLIEREL